MLLIKDKTMPLPPKIDIATRLQLKDAVERKEDWNPQDADCQESLEIEDAEPDCGDEDLTAAPEGPQPSNLLMQLLARVNTKTKE